MTRFSRRFRLLAVFLEPAAIASLLLALALLSGCAPDSRVVARVGNQVITVGDFQELAEAAASRSFAPPDTAKHLLLDQMIDRSLLLNVAGSRPPLPDAELAARRTAIEQDALARALVQRLSPGDVGVSDAEVERFYAQRGEATHVQIVYTPDEAEVRAAKIALGHGEAFSSVATRFDFSGQLPPGGDLGFIQPGMLVSPVDQVVRDAAVGSVVGPLESPGQGWFIIRIIAREHREQPPLAAEATQLRQMLAQRKQRSFTLKRYTDLRNAYGVTTDPDGIRRLYDRFGAPQQMRAMNGEPEPPPLTATERATVLGRWDGGARFQGAYTLGDADTDMREQKGNRIDNRQTLAFEQWVRGRILQRVALLEARRRHLEDEPDVARHIRQSLDNELLQAVYQSEIVAKAEPTDMEVRDVYARNLEAFSELKSARLQYMTLPDSSSAANAVERVRTAPSLREAVLLSSKSLRVQEETVAYPAHERLWQMLQGTLLHEPVGTTLGPFHVESGWRIVQLAERTVKTTPYEALDAETRDGLRREAVSAASQRRLATVTDSVRRAVHVFVDEAVLKSIRWPSPGGMTVIPG